MEIKISSWHYRLIKRTTMRRPADNLCEYFWELVFCILMISTIVGLGLVVGFGFIAAMLAPILYLFGIHMDSGLIGAGVGMWSLGFIFLVIWGWGKFTEITRDNKEAVSRHLHAYQWEKPNMFFEYVKAKKQKVCPRIMFIDESTEEDEV